MNASAIIIDFENHRSRERIKNMGEVFTPEQYVQQLMSTLDSKVWSDENFIFFEPTCGHGNIVLPLLIKRVKELKKKYERAGVSKSTLHAIANALNTFWAIDICAANVDLTKKRVFEFVLHELKELNFGLHQARNREFVAHVLCTLNRQIHMNEALSALGSASAASHTKVGHDWMKKNGHKPIDFKNAWCDFFCKSQQNKVEPIEYQRAIRFIESALENKTVRGFEEFSYAKDFIGLKVSSGNHARDIEGIA